MISVDPEEMKVAKRLNGTVINGHAGYYGNITCDEGGFFIIAIPHNQKSVAILMREIDSKK